MGRTLPKHEIVILDGYAANPGDLHWDPISECGELTIYDDTSEELILERVRSAQYIVTNKCQINSSSIDKLPELKCICVSATGYNNVDVAHARSKGVDVCNVVGYSSPSVAQHVFAMLLTITNHIKQHSDGVHKGDWARSEKWCYWNSPLTELAGMTLGVYGYGKIGQQVAEIASSFGMKVIASRKSHKKPNNPKVILVSDHDLLAQSDVLSLHAPLTKVNKEFINKESLRLMKATAILINTGRGGLVNEFDLAQALTNHQIAWAAIDVLNQEPPLHKNPLYNLSNCVITPHIAWATKQSRSRLIEGVADNIRAHQSGNPQNVVN